MNLEIFSTNCSQAKSYLLAKDCSIKSDLEIDFAIGVRDENGTVHGIISMTANGTECLLAHLYTDGTALVGSILYGAAWRAAKALGYKKITI